jgi:hypothetical protein
MAVPVASQLDANQCIQGAYDDAKGRLRVEGEATIVNGALEVYIQATDDNIAIRNTSNGYELKINADGSINTVATFSGTVAVGSPDKSSFVYGTSNELSIGGVFQDTSPTLTAGQAGAVRLTNNRAFHVNLRDSSGNEINNSNPLSVTLSPGSSGLPISNYSEVTSVASGVLTTILTYTVPAAVSLYLNRIEIAGTNISQYSIQFNAVTNAKKYTGYTSLNDVFDYTMGGSEDGFQLSTGTVVTVKTIHNRPFVGDFNARLQGFLL